MKRSLEPMMTSNKDDWETPDYLFDPYHKAYLFTVDAAANQTNHKVDRWWGPGGELPCGLEASWQGERVWCNPPYGRKTTHKWLQKAAKKEAEVAVLLLPARTSNDWFHRYVLDTADEIRFIRGRVRFVGAETGAPFPSMIVIYKRDTLPGSIL